ncbi:DUF4190 domain-containing protein [Gordonia sp. LSe1-13]|uniref:DUF4190 domain-containing protein n=1 Tax=Gordonia sesuvii TaxID=3116777 RepID=A0ABU7MGB7_9ACTN|nr:DUF4190 domain-containing protein [Gordonia sp. LSe1-13]
MAAEVAAQATRQGESATDAATEVRPAPSTDADDFRPLDVPERTEKFDAPAERPQAYSSIKTDDNPTIDDVPEEQVPTRSQPATARSSRPAKSRGTNRTAIWALVLSILGITSPIGLYLGYRARGEIARTRELGESFARVAIWIGWLYIAVIVLGLLTYFWISGQGA